MVSHVNSSPQKLVIAKRKTKPAESKSRYKVPNLERGLRIMEFLLDYPEGLSQSELAAHLHYSKTSVFRITMTLLDYGYLVRNEESKNITLSRKLLAMGSKALNEKDLMGSALDVVRYLRDVVKETVLIGTLAGGEFIVLEQVLGSHPFKFSVDVGSRLPLHAAAPAKALLAFLPAQECETLIAKIDFIRFNARTITSAEGLREELESVRQHGYALDRGEQLAGIHCVAAPILDRHGYPIAAVWTTGPADRIRERDLATIGDLFTSQVKIISGRLGYGLLEAAS
jgi:DNA-binding IclR family transcriptional regulator